MFYLALVLAMHIETTPPQIVGGFKNPDSCALAAIKANARPEVNTEEALRAGAVFVCLAVLDGSY